jgi:solute carrier family 25 (mitochondrial adenine nucleotide translocator), member 4/5/6/31
MWGEFRWMLHTIRDAARDEGLAAFWRGHTTNLRLSVPPRALKFAFFTVLFYDRDLNPFLAGAEAGFLSLTIFYPIDRMRTLLSKNNRNRTQGSIRYNGLMDVWRHHKITQIYSGFAASSIGVVIYRGLDFGLYYSLKSEKSWTWNAIVAYSATLVASLVSYPLDSVRRRITYDPNHPDPSFASFWSKMPKIIQTEGVGSLMRGYQYLGWRSITGGSTLLIFDWLFVGGWKRDKVDI